MQDGKVQGLVGADLVEVSPPFDSSSKLTSMTGAMMLFEILCAVVGGRHAK
ncbi:MAG: arginase family protein, partial [Pseudomonadota bacterium]|nr:arginase family protein [Pseudomonadota bacterium]